MTLSYSVYLKFEDGTEDWLYPAYTTHLEPGQWVRVNSDYQDGDSGCAVPPENLRFQPVGYGDSVSLHRGRGVGQFLHRRGELL